MQQLELSNDLDPFMIFYVFLATRLVSGDMVTWWGLLLLVFDPF